ncbi:MAG: transposase, partial [Planctomycetota bacterium]
MRNVDHGEVTTPTPDAALVRFRTEFYRCLPSWGDALFELCDASLCSPAPVGSVPGLSLEPVFRRSHGSLYKALAQGGIDYTRLRELLVANRPSQWPQVFAVDASTWDRCDAETSAERGFYYSASKHSNGQPIVAGWSYQWITQLDWAPDSWTAPLDALRIPPTTDALTATVEQIQRLVNLLDDNDNDGDIPMFVLDAGYDPIALGAALSDTRAQILVRISPKRVFHPHPTQPPHRLGPPR